MHMQNFAAPPAGTRPADTLAAGRAEQARHVFDRTALWLPLLHELTEACQRWAVLKNVDSALRGTGDLDSIAEPAEWPRIRSVFERWARVHRLDPVVVCKCRPGGPRFIAFQPGASHIVQLDVMDRRPFRGSPFLATHRLLELTVVDPRGFRCVRPGAEAVLKLCLNGIRPGGGRNEEGLRAKGVNELLRADPEGMRAAATTFGVASASVVALAEASAAGGWDHRAALTIEARALLLGVANPLFTLRQFWYRNLARPCGMKLSNRLAPADPKQFVRGRVAARHEISWAEDAPQRSR